MSATDKKFGRRSYVTVLEKSLKYVEDRKEGRIKSLLTPWPGLNKKGVAGIEWGSIVTIGARPGAGKTMIVSQLLREARKLNPTQDFNILEFQFEMGDKQYGARQFAGEMALDYGRILSTEKQLDDFTFNQIKKYIQDCRDMEKAGLIRDVISDPLNHTQIEEAIMDAYVEWNSKPLIVTIDHSWLIKKRSDEKEKIATLYNTTDMLMRIKNKIPVIIVMVTQLNRSIDEASRKVPSSIANYPNSSDIFGGDALMHGSDMILVLNRPAKVDIKSYGPYAYECKDQDVFMHILKNRNAKDDDNLLFLHMDGERQRMIEVPEPVSHRPEGTYIRRSDRTGTACRIVSAEIGKEL